MLESEVDMSKKKLRKNLRNCIVFPDGAVKDFDDEERLVNYIRKYVPGKLPFKRMYGGCGRIGRLFLDVEVNGLTGSIKSDCVGTDYCMNMVKDRRRKKNG